MKRVYSKNALWSCMLAIAFALFGAGQLAAQTQATTIGTPGITAKSGVYAAPQGSYVNSNAAQILLENAMTDLKDQLALLQQGTAPYNALLNKYQYYNQINLMLKSGQMNVQGAIVAALRRMSLMGITQTALQLMKQEAVDLLHV